MILLVFIIIVIILLFYYIKKIEKYDLVTDYYGVQVKPVETLDLEVLDEGSLHLRFDHSKQAWDLYFGDSSDDNPEIYREYLITSIMKDIHDSKTGNKKVPSYDFGTDYGYKLLKRNDMLYFYEDSSKLNYLIFNWVIPTNDLYVPINPPTFTVNIVNSGLDVTANFTNVKNPNYKYTVSIHEEGEKPNTRPSNLMSQEKKGYNKEIISYKFNDNEEETFSLNWKENSPGTKKYIVKLNGRTHSKNHEITINNDDNTGNGIYKINKINFKWYNTNGINETVEEWVIVVKKDGYAPLETINIVKDDSDFFKNFKETPNLELLKDHAFKNTDDIAGIKVYLYYFDNSGIKKLLNTSEFLPLNQKDFNMELSNYFQPINDDFTNKNWTDIYSERNKDCVAEFVKDGNEYICDKDANENNTGGFNCQNWKYNITVEGIGEGNKCLKNNNDVITVNWPTQTNLQKYKNFEVSVSLNPNDNSDLINNPLLNAVNFGEHFKDPENNLDCIGSWETTDGIIENCDDKDYLTCQKWTYNITREKTGNGTECNKNKGDELITKYPSSESMILYKPDIDTKWNSIDDLNPNKNSLLEEEPTMYVKPFEDYKEINGNSETEIQKELKITDENIHLYSYNCYNNDTDLMMAMNDKYTVIYEYTDCDQYKGLFHLIYNDTKEEKNNIVVDIKNDSKKNISSIDILDDYVIVGLKDEGKVYIFEIDSNGNLTTKNTKTENDGAAIIEFQKSIYDTGENRGNYFRMNGFGTNVAFSGNYLVVTAPVYKMYVLEPKDWQNKWQWDSIKTGVTYIYEKGDGDYWDTNGTLIEDISDNIAVSDNTVIIGKNIYKQNLEGKWIKIQTLTHEGPVSILDNYMLVGSPNNNAVYMYINKGGTDPWNKEETIVPSDNPKEFDKFGCSVSLSNNYAIIGAEGEQTRRGAVYIYKRIYGKLDKGTRVYKPEHPVDKKFGSSVAVSDNYAVILPSTLGVYVIDLLNVNYSEIEVLNDDERDYVRYVWIGYEWAGSYIWWDKSNNKFFDATTDDSAYEGYKAQDKSLTLHKIKVISNDEDIVEGFGETYGNVESRTTGQSKKGGTVKWGEHRSIMFDKNATSSKNDYFGTQRDKNDNWIKIDLGKNYPVEDIQRVEVYNNSHSWLKKYWGGTYVKLLNFEEDEIRRSNEMVTKYANEASTYYQQDFTFPTKDEIVKYIWIGFEKDVDYYSLALSDIRVFASVNGSMTKNITSGFGTRYSQVETSGYKMAKDQDKEYKENELPAQVLFQGKFDNYYQTTPGKLNWIKINLGKAYKIEDIKRVEVYNTNATNLSYSTWDDIYVKILDLNGNEIKRIISYDSETNVVASSKKFINDN